MDYFKYFKNNVILNIKFPYLLTHNESINGVCLIKNN